MTRVNNKLEGMLKVTVDLLSWSGEKHEGPQDSRCRG